ncbi:MAG: carbohydrate binding family 9 domain-containing protein, partial [bacterium]|nr:carbohydrate binding family 9 domain-containing protein [bacterium]
EGRGGIGAEEWAGATKLARFIQFEPQNGAPATQRTVAYLLYDERNFYVAVYAHDTDPDSITGQLTNRDGELAKDDSITVYLDTFHDRRSCYYFATNTLATQSDGRIKNDGKVRNKNWDAEWQVAATTASDGWMAEFAIPLRNLQFRSGEDRSWGINIGRSRRSNLGRDFWAGPIESPSRVSQYGELTGLTLPGETAKRWDFIPYVLGRYRQGANTTGDAGFDFRYAFRPETTTHVTVNPDFAIIEADEEFVNLTRFEVRLDEKRPFFLESNDRFGQRIQTFYSRRIGDIDAGGNLLSRHGGWDLTLLSVRSAPLPIEAPGEVGPRAVPVEQNGEGRQVANVALEIDVLLEPLLELIRRAGVEALDE